MISFWWMIHDLTTHRNKNTNHLYESEHLHKKQTDTYIHTHTNTHKRNCEFHSVRMRVSVIVSSRSSSFSHIYFIVFARVGFHCCSIQHSIWTLIIVHLWQCSRSLRFHCLFYGWICICSYCSAHIFVSRPLLV